MIKQHHLLPSLRKRIHLLITLQLYMIGYFKPLKMQYVSSVRSKISSQKSTLTTGPCAVNQPLPFHFRVLP